MCCLSSPDCSCSSGRLDQSLPASWLAPIASSSAPGGQVLDRHRGPAPPRSQQHQGGVDCHPVDPAAELRPAGEAVQVLPGRQQRVLQHLAGVVLVAQQAHGDPVQPFFVAIDQLFEGSQITGPGPGDQLVVAGRRRRRGRRSVRRLRIVRRSHPAQPIRDSGVMKYTPPNAKPPSCREPPREPTVMPPATPTAMPPAMPPATPISITFALLKAARPHQWVKNLFVAAPLVFAQLMYDPQAMLRTAAGGRCVSACCPARSI